MTPEMSEFSFGFALTAELVHYYSIALTGAPRFPTQNEEGRTGGYDVELPRRGVPLFLQFKRSDCMVRGNADEASQLGVPYFRMPLMARHHSDQHALLLQLESQGHEVYYAAPRFHRMAELNDAYIAQVVATRTSLFYHHGLVHCPTIGSTLSLLSKTTKHGYSAPSSPDQLRRCLPR
jgi:hypothetical protein